MTERTDRSNHVEPAPRRLWRPLLAAALTAAAMTLGGCDAFMQVYQRGYIPPEGALVDLHERVAAAERHRRGGQRSGQQRPPQAPRGRLDMIGSVGAFRHFACMGDRSGATRGTRTNGLTPPLPETANLMISLPFRRLGVYLTRSMA